jgi:hypothetical protein
MTSEPDTRPAFLSGQNLRDAKILFEEKGCDVFQLGDEIEMQVIGAWKPRHTKLANQYNVNTVHITEASFDGRTSADFLLDLPPLRNLGLISGEPRDFSAVNRMTELRTLRMSLPRGEAYVGKSIDFSALKNLENVRVWWRPELAGILRCASLESLWISDGEEMCLRELDLSGLPRLRMLHVQQAPKLKVLDLRPLPDLWELSMLAMRGLKSVALHPAAQVRALNISGVGGWRINWDRMGEDLEFLQVWGPLKWPLTDVLRAVNLKELHTNAIRTFPPLEFLKQLKHLCLISVFTTPPGPKLTDADWAVIRQINARGGPNP